jgi:hypothetical protein
VAYARLSLMTPLHDRERRVREVLDQLIEFYTGREGFIAAYRLDPDPHVASHRVGRISVWESEQHANRTAAEPYDMALQSQLRLLVDDATREERGFRATVTRPREPAL